jgi:GGDEF domain-containing protein
MFSRIKRIYREYKELRYLAYHDSLTGLLNRNWLYKNMNQIKAKYVYFIDINNLHTINKNGHSFGDSYIKKAIETIKHKGVLLRYAGDEFLLFSDFENEINTNDIFSVGVSIISNSIEEAIKNADLKMIASKKCFKSNKK